jgi:hypothetical protein
MSRPLGGAPGVPPAGHPFLSLCPLFCLLWAALTRLAGFCLRTLSFSRPTTIVGHILDTVVVSNVVGGMVCEE